MSGSQSLSPQGRRPSSSRRPSTHRICDFGTEHISLLAHTLATEDLETANQQLRRKLSEKDEELLKYHNECGDLKNQLRKAQDLYSEASKVFQVAKEAEAESEREIEALEKERDDYKESLEKYKAALDKANSNIRAIKEKRDESEKQLAIRTAEHDQLRAQAQKRSRSPSVERLSVENKKLLRESQDIRKRASQIVGPEWKSEDPKEALDILKQRLEEVTTARNEAQATAASVKIQLEEANRRAEIKQAITPEPESDLTPLSDLHPALARSKGQTARQLADALVEAITFDLNDIWSHLPHQQEEALVTPSTRRIDIILNRLKEAVKKDSNLKLAPELSQARTKIQDLNKELASVVQSYSAKDKQFKIVQNRNKQLRDQINGWKTLLGIEDEEETEEIEKYVRRLREQADTKPWINLLTRHNLIPRHNIFDLRKQFEDIVSEFVKQQEEKLSPAAPPVVIVTPTTPTTSEGPIRQLEELVDLLRSFLT